MNMMVLTRPTSNRNVLESLEVLLKKYIETSNDSENILDIFDNLKDKLSDLKFNNLTQRSIVNYFTKVN